MNFKEYLKETRYYWGEKGAGILIFATSTKRFLIGLRSFETKEGGTFGTFGGKFDYTDKTAEDVAIREFQEETNYYDDVELIPLFIFQDVDFEYHNFLGLMENEFKPDLNWEMIMAKWVTLDELLKIPNKHFGLFALLKDPKSFQIIKGCTR